MIQNTLTSSSYREKLEIEVLSTYCFNVELLKQSDAEHLFLYPQHKNIYKGLKECVNGKVIDTMKLLNCITEEEFNYYLSLAEHYVTSANYQNNLARLEDMYRVNKILEMSENLGNGSLSYDEYVKRINKLNDEYSSFANDDKIDIKDVLHLITTEQSVLEMVGFDRMSGSIKFRANTLNVIGARPSVGKSAFALNMFDAFSKVKNNRCIYLNMEMTEKEIYERLVGMNANIPISKFGEKEASGKMIAKIQSSIEEITRRDIKLIHKPVSIGFIEKLLQSEKRSKKNVGKNVILFVDYLGYVSSKSRSNNDRERLGEIVRNMQIFTKTYQVTIFLLAQINRDGADKPSIENLKDTGELEQSAHCCMILIDDDSQLQDPIHDMRVLVAKNRSGMRNGYMFFTYNKSTQKFIEGKKNDNLRG